MSEDLIEAQAGAVRLACERMAPGHLRELRDTVDNRLSAARACGWDRKATGYAETFRMLADTLISDAGTSRMLSDNARLVYELMIAAGPGIDRLAASSERRLLARLRAGDAEGASLELENYLRLLHFMWRLVHRGH